MITAGAIVAILDLGTHLEKYNDGKTAEVRKAFIVFELDKTDHSTGANQVIGKEVSIKFSPQSTLRKLLEGMRGKVYMEGEQVDVLKALGKSGLVTTQHKTSSKGTVYEVIESVQPIPKGMPIFKPTYPLLMWEMGRDIPFPEEKWLPEWFHNGKFASLKTIMESSKEMRGKTPAPNIAYEPQALKAIQTRYKGYRFRSRLEARWAVFLDALGINYAYELEGFDLGEGDLYLPDFHLPLPGPYPSYPEGIPPVRSYWLEVKPFDPTEKEKRKAMKLATMTGHHVWIFAGHPLPGKFKILSAMFQGKWSCEEYWEYGSDSLYGFLCNTVGYLPNGDCVETPDHKEIENALIKASQARFEHGETP